MCCWRLKVAEIIDEVVGARRIDAQASVGTYAVLAVANRVVDPCSKRRFADLRLVGLGLVVSTDSGIPLVSHAYPGNKPDVTPARPFTECDEFRNMIIQRVLDRKPELVVIASAYARRQQVVDRATDEILDRASHGPLT